MSKRNLMPEPKCSYHNQNDKKFSLKCFISDETRFFGSRYGNIFQFSRRLSILLKLQTFFYVQRLGRSSAWNMRLQEITCKLFLYEKFDKFL